MFLNDNIQDITSSTSNVENITENNHPRNHTTNGYNGEIINNDNGLHNIETNSINHLTSEGNNDNNNNNKTTDSDDELYEPQTTTDGNNTFGNTDNGDNV